MKPMLFIAGAVSALAVSPALAQYEPPNRFDATAHAAAYGTGGAPKAMQCFNGQKIKAVSRSGERTLLVQNGGGAIYEVTLKGPCAAADRATKISAMSSLGAPICADDTAVLFARTDEGLKRCKIADVRRLSSGELAALSPAPRR